MRGSPLFTLTFPDTKLNQISFSFLPESLNEAKQVVTSENQVVSA